MTARVFDRSMESAALEGLQDFPAVVLEGARHVGKSHLAKGICRRLGGKLLDMDHMPTVSEVQSTQAKAIDRHPQMVAVGEVLAVKRLARHVKFLVDSNWREGMFLLTTSRFIDGKDTVNHALAGRLRTLHMRPLSQFELSSDCRAGRNFIEAVVSGATPPDRGADDIAGRVAHGGYPAVVSRRTKAHLMREYVNGAVESDVRRQLKARQYTDAPRMLACMANSLGQATNIRKMAGALGVSHFKADRLHKALVNLYVAEPLPSYRMPLRGRKVSTRPKTFLNDSGLGTTLLKLDGKDLEASAHWKPLLDNFVLSELRKHLELSSMQRAASLHYYNEHNHFEVDFLLQIDWESVVAIELKAATHLRNLDRVALAKFRKDLGERCLRAIILYCGDKHVRYDDGVEAWPISSLIHPW